MYTQEILTKKEKDMSKNLVTGEIQYRPKKKKGCMIALVVAVGALALSLAVLTVVREMQIARLRSEVDQLTVNMIAVTANIKSLNQRVNRNLDDFKTLDDDTIYADGEEGPVSMSKDSEALGKLKDLTVLEDDTDDLTDDMDDDDYGDDDEESGYWYEEYDKRPKNGRTNMVHLKQEDLLGSVVTQGQKRADHSSSIHQIHRMMNGLDSVTVGPPKEREQTAVRDKRSVFPDSNTNDAVITKPEDSLRRKTKKFSTVDSPKITRTVRNSDDEGRRPFVAAHFHGNTSHLNPDIHEHYRGNGLVRVAHDAPHNVWYPAPWTMRSPHPRPTLTNKGHIHVRDTGVYFVYVQIYYLDTHDIISWVLHRTNADVEGRETLLQCAQSAHSSEPLEKPNSCFSAAALFLKAGDRLAVRNTGGDRHSLMEPEKSFIGLVKLADAEDPNEEL